MGSQSLKIIFLDIDGVLNSSRSVRASIKKPNSLDDMVINTIDPIAVGLINYLVKDYNAYIVVSSSHRLRFFEGGTVYDENLRCYKRAVFNLSKLQEYMGRLGISQTERVIDGTPDIFSADRGTQIQEWLNNHDKVTHYVIIDDDADMLKSQKLNFVQTDPDEGLTFKNYCQIERILIHVN